jgi:hypothetical protein
MRDPERLETVAMTGFDVIHAIHRPVENSAVPRHCLIRILMLQIN